jgi:hypothetical protein
MKTRTQRSGRVLSAANEAKLREAIDHCQQSIALMQAVLDANDQTTIENSWRHAPVN